MKGGDVAFHALSQGARLVFRSSSILTVLDFNEVDVTLKNDRLMLFGDECAAGG